MSVIGKLNLELLWGVTRGMYYGSSAHILHSAINEIHLEVFKHTLDSSGLPGKKRVRGKKNKSQSRTTPKEPLCIVNIGEILH